MRTPLKILIAASALVIGITAAPALYAKGAKDTPSTQTSPMGHDGMMGRGSMMGHGDMMDDCDMKGMKKMMEKHSKMMQSMMEMHGARQSDKK